MNDILAKLARWAKQYPDAVAGDHAGEELLELVRSIRIPPTPLNDAHHATRIDGLGPADVPDRGRK